MTEPALEKATPATAELPVYPGLALENVTLVTTEALADEALAALMAEEVVGFDTESKPTFLKGEVSTGPHLVQLATATRAYLFPIFPSQSNDNLKAILESPRLLKVGFGLGNDLGALKSRLNIAVRNVLDLGEVLRGPAHRGTVGAKSAVAHFFGQQFRKSRKIGTSNWASRRLTERQLMYAANDAYAALQVYQAWRRERERRDSGSAEARRSS